MAATLPDSRKISIHKNMYLDFARILLVIREAGKSQQRKLIGHA